MTAAPTPAPSRAHGAATRFDYLYRRDAIDAVLARFAPPELASPLARRVDANGFAPAAVLDRLQTRVVERAPAARPLRLVDLGCGGGGVGLWLAEILDAELAGIDASPLALDRAAASAARFCLSRPPRFARGTFEASGLPSSCAEIALSTDALYLAPDRAAALGEVRRLLVADGLLVFNAYPAAAADDWSAVLQASGFAILEIADHSDEWRDIMARKHRARLAHADWLRSQLGAAAEPELAVSRSMLGVEGPSFLAVTRRIEIAARRL